MGALVDIRSVRKDFLRKRQASRAVDDVTLTIQGGELFFLLGPSGCGKTTLLRMVAGFTQPTGGTIHFNARDVTPLPPNRRNTGMVFQSYALWPHMTVAANVAFGLGVRKVPKPERDRRVREALAEVRLEALADRKPTELSGGQQQRVALARALVVRPDVLLLDEPLSNLDARLRVELRGEIRRICKAAGLTTIYVTHDQGEALSMADRIAIMHKGRVVQVGPPAELYRRPVSRFVAEFLGESNFLDVTAVQADTDGAWVTTGAGRLRALVAPASPAVASIRPEAVRLGAPDEPGGWSGRIVDTVYLGDLAHHLVEAQGAMLRSSEQNPRVSRVGSSVTVHVDPRDVVFLPPEVSPRA